MTHHHLIHHTASQALVAITVHRTDRLGDLVSGLVPVQELLQVPPRDTWLETEVTHQTDLTVVVGVAVQARALLRHRRRDTRAPGLAHRAVDKFSLKASCKFDPYSKLFHTPII